MNLLEAGLATSQDPAFEVLLGILAQRLNTPPKTRLRGFSSSRSGRRMQRGPSTPPRATGYRAHPYNISLGRPEWQSRDPLKNAERKEGPNLYGYVRNNPVNRADPEGLGFGADVARMVVALPALLNGIFSPPTLEPPPEPDYSKPPVVTPADSGKSCPAKKQPTPPPTPPSGGPPIKYPDPYIPAPAPAPKGPAPENLNLPETLPDFFLP